MRQASVFHTSERACRRCPLSCAFDMLSLCPVCVPSLLCVSSLRPLPPPPTARKHQVSFPEFVKGMRRADSSSDDNKRISASVPPPSYLSSNSAGEASEPSSEHPREAVAATSHQESREEFSDRNSGDAESAAAANAEGRGSRAANRGRKGIPVQERVTVSRVLAAGTASENRGIGGEQLMVAAEGTSSSRSIAKGISTRCGCVVS